MAKCPYLKIPIAAHSDMDDCTLPAGRDCPYPETSCYDTDRPNPAVEDEDEIGGCDHGIEVR